MKYIILLILLTGCNQYQEAKYNSSKPMVDFGFIMYDDFNRTQIYFIPLKKECEITNAHEYFKSNCLGDAFAFIPSERITNDLLTLKKIKIPVFTYDIKHRKHTGNVICVPVRIVYEIDTNIGSVYAGNGFKDTVSYQEDSPSNRIIKFNVVFPGADVLKLTRIK